MDLAPSAETIDPAKLCTSKTTPLSKLPRYGGYSSASRLTKSVFVNLEKVVEATGIFPWLLWRLQQWGGRSCGFPACFHHICRQN